MLRRTLCAVLLGGAAGAAAAQADAAANSIGAPAAGQIATATTAPSSGAAASAPPSVATARAWSLRLPTADLVVFRGARGNDTSGLGATPMMYPAPGAAGLLVAIVTHGAIVSGVRDAQRDRAQREADEVLKPYESVLGQFTNRSLMEAGLRDAAVGERKRLLGPGDQVGSDWLIESAPIFSMTQDRAALVLDNVVHVYAPGSSSIAYTRTLRIVSEPIPPKVAPVTPDGEAKGASPASPWLDADGRVLTKTSVALFAESLELALDPTMTELVDDKLPQRTVRYREGSHERIERAQVLRERCGRVLLRTLRGWTMSVPARDRSATPECTDAPG